MGHNTVLTHVFKVPPFPIKALLTYMLMKEHGWGARPAMSGALQHYRRQNSSCAPKARQRMGRCS